MTFPDNENLPSKPSSNITAKLLRPVVSVGGRHAIAAVTAMLVPKATMHEDDLPWAGENKIWIPRKIPTMQSEPIAERMRQLANDHLRFRVFRTHLCHNKSALLGSYGVQNPNPLLISVPLEVLLGANHPSQLPQLGDCILEGG